MAGIPREFPAICTVLCPLHFTLVHFYDAWYDLWLSPRRSRAPTNRRRRRLGYRTKSSQKQLWLGLGLARHELEIDASPQLRARVSLTITLTLTLTLVVSDLTLFYNPSPNPNTKSNSKSNPNPRAITLYGEKCRLHWKCVIVRSFRSEERVLVRQNIRINTTLSRRTCVQTYRSRQHVENAALYVKSCVETFSPVKVMGKYVIQTWVSYDKKGI